ncbi:MAG: type II secretion system F family protein [Porticoccaceae bacterium]|nr:type II secretion system F family protein [Porticoccaceae bacterium]
MLKMLMRELSDDISVGDSFARALRKHPQQFDDLFCNMVEVGESSGTLATILERLSNHKEQSERLKVRIKKALTYPCIVLLVAVLVTAVLLTKVVPGFAQTFGEFGADLPGITLFVLELSEIFQRLWLYLVAACISCCGGFLLVKKRSLRISRLADRIVPRLPIVGKLTRNLILARFSRTLATTFTAGQPILDALKATATTVNNSFYTEIIQIIRQDLAHGVSLYRAVGKQPAFPAALQQMINVGEESGSLGQILDRAGRLYERDVELSLDTIIPLIEPVMMLVLGLLVGGLLLAMYLPIFQLGHII